MSLNISKGNMYDFISHTWNTIKGECPHLCSYCYMHRWGKQKAVHFDQNELKSDHGEGKFIFVGSSCDMFANEIPGKWAYETINYCTRFANKYFFQTKNPYNIIPFKDIINKLLFQPAFCTTIESNRWYQDIMKNSPRADYRALGMSMLDQFGSRNCYVTVEPILDFDLGPMVELIAQCNPVQVNIGADSGNCGLPEPAPDKIMELISRLKTFTNVKLKKNLSRIIKELP